MKLVDVTFTLDGRKAVFFFTAENRVDFRELVKDLAQALKLKIEMRQVGVRDEARRLGGVGCCGRSLCCCTFLKDFVSVSIRMAKDQNVSLNPTKVSGICGRLMCCLSYEYDGSAKRPGKDKKSAEAAACPGTCAGQPETAAAPAPGQPAAHRPGGRRIFGRQERPGGPTPGSAERGNRPPSFGQRRPEGNRPEGGRPQPSGDRHAKGPFPRRDERRRP